MDKLSRNTPIAENDWGGGRLPTSGQGLGGPECPHTQGGQIEQREQEEQEEQELAKATKGRGRDGEPATSVAVLDCSGLVETTTFSGPFQGLSYPGNTVLPTKNFKNFGMAAAAIWCPVGLQRGVFLEHFAFSFGGSSRRSDACTVDTSPT